MNQCGGESARGLSVLIDPANENATVVVQGIPNGKHTLELVTDDAARLPAIDRVRTYRPPVKSE